MECWSKGKCLKLLIFKKNWFYELLSPAPYALRLYLCFSTLGTCTPSESIAYLRGTSNLRHFSSL